ncbi:MAG: site-specific integrase [Methanoregula sp.]|nr:site-specific integrase [Methanoregula sp.]MDP2797423.1 site-specific integrase [Methanoregula sp.]
MFKFFSTLAGEVMIVSSWRNDYPLPITPDAFVFLTNKKAPLGYAGLAKQLPVIAKRAGITKHITPHIFRHTRATLLIRQGYGEAIVKKLLWGNLNSKMFSTCLHLVDSDVERVIAEKAGSITKEERSKTLKACQCPRCFTVNGQTRGFFLMRADVNSLKEAANKVMQAKTRGRTPAGVSGNNGPGQRRTVADAECPKTLIIGVIPPENCSIFQAPGK